MRVTFWGVRGTFPVTGSTFARYGGDTMCVEVECSGARLILDAGSGLRALGAKLCATAGKVEAQIVLSHTHLDHILGLPHFAPFWRDDARVTIYAAEEGGDAKHSVYTMLSPPLFPVDSQSLPAEIALAPFRAGESFSAAPDVRVTTVPLSHQGPSAGLIVEAAGRKLCYVTDHEHGDSNADDRLASAIERADLLIYDATFTDAEWQAHRGWGHSTWEEGVRLKRRSGTRLLGLVHHDPDRTDRALDRLSEAAAARCENVFFARQGLSLEI